jgi:uncharacterized repeat protein (TIGR01451 family)
VWFTERDANKIGRITTAGTVTEFGVLSTSSSPANITTGPDGNLWFTEATASKIGRITTAGTVTEFDIPTAFSFPTGITTGLDGNLWFTEATANKIGRITTAGTVTEFDLPTASGLPISITAGPDGNLWFTEAGANRIGRIMTAGTFVEFAVPAAPSSPYGISAGPDGNLWFTESNANRIGRVELASDVSVSPTSLNFGDQPGGTTSSAQTLTITNTGARNLSVSSVTYAGTNPGDFATAAATCPNASVAPGQTCTIRVNFTPTATASRSASLIITDDVNNVPGSQQTVSLAGNGTPRADLGLSIGASPSPVRSGTKLTYSITVQNGGPTAASGVAVTDALPSVETFLSASATQGTCSTPTVGASGTLNCSLGTLANGATATINMVVKVTSFAPSSVSNTASATSNAPDANTTNNSATVTVPVFGRH